MSAVPMTRAPSFPDHPSLAGTFARAREWDIANGTAACYGMFRLISNDRRDDAGRERIFVGLQRGVGNGLSRKDPKRL
jgi:hypothetical protein